MIKRRILCHIMVVVTVLLSSGCAGTMQMYAGERRAKDEVAFIKTESGSGSGHLLGPWSTHILAVDGQEIGGHSSVEVLPGEHVVKAALSFMFNLEQQSFEDPKPLTFPQTRIGIHQVFRPIAIHIRPTDRWRDRCEITREVGYDMALGQCSIAEINPKPKLSNGSSFHHKIG